MPSYWQTQNWSAIMHKNLILNRLSKCHHSPSAPIEIEHSAHVLALLAITRDICVQRLKKVTSRVTALVLKSSIIALTTYTKIL